MIQVLWRISIRVRTFCFWLWLGRVGWCAAQPWRHSTPTTTGHCILLQRSDLRERLVTRTRRSSTGASLPLTSRQTFGLNLTLSTIRPAVFSHARCLGSATTSHQWRPTGPATNGWLTFGWIGGSTTLHCDAVFFWRKELAHLALQQNRSHVFLLYSFFPRPSSQDARNVGVCSKPGRISCRTFAQRGRFGKRVYFLWPNSTDICSHLILVGVGP